jgi:hypothetical protein
MNKHLDMAVERVKALPDEKQREAAELLFEFVEDQDSEIYLTPEQIGEIERRLPDAEPFATDEQVRAVFDRLTK